MWGLWTLERTLLVAISRGFAAGNQWKLFALVKGGKAMQAAKVGTCCWVLLL